MLVPAWGIALWLFAATVFSATPPRFDDRRLWWFPPEAGGRAHWRLFETRLDPSGREFPERLGELDPRDGRWLRGIRTRRVFRLDLADLDGDGEEEILAGVDRRMASFGRLPAESPRGRVESRVWRRIYVYSAEASHLAPRWLGSRFAHRLLDFSVEPALPGAPKRAPRILRTRETAGGRTLIGRYRWDQFGFRTISMQEEKP